MYKNILSIDIMNTFNLSCNRIKKNDNSYIKIRRVTYNCVCNYDKISRMGFIRTKYDIGKFIYKIIKGICVKEIKMKRKDIKFSIKNISFYVKSKNKLRFSLLVDYNNPLNKYIQDMLNTDGRHCMYSLYVKNNFI